MLLLVLVASFGALIEGKMDVEGLPHRPPVKYHCPELKGWQSTLDGMSI